MQLDNALPPFILHKLGKIDVLTDHERAIRVVIFFVTVTSTR